MTEAEFEGCVRRICAGDKSGLKDIYEAYMPYLYTTIFYVLQNKENAEDVTSDFFIKFWTLAEDYKPGNGHKGYLATIARNMAIDYLRKHKREVLVDGFEENKDRNRGDKENAAPIPDSPEEASLSSGWQSSTVENDVVAQISLKEAMEHLKPEEKEIIHMKVMGDLTFKEISNILNVPMGTVTWRYREGIEKLRRCGYE